METQNSNRDLEPLRRENRSSRGRNMGGLIIVLIGVVLLAKQVGVDFPYWVFSWPMLLVAIGIYIGVRHSFRNPGWIFPTAIGTIFLMERLIPELELKQFIWPIILIVVGLLMVIRPRGRRRNRRNDYWKRWDNREPSSEYFADNAFETVTIFGSDKKQIISKDFKGGESVCIFGGSEINLTQADINGAATIEVVQLFGGTKIIVPPHWKVQTDELVCILGGLEDKRQVAGSAVDPTKILILKGTCIFGGIDLRSF